MTISIWRYSHLALAVSSFLLLALASITGIILTIEPVSEKVHPYKAEHFDQITLAQALPALRHKYPGISELTVDANQFVQIKGSDAQGKNMLVYVDPLTGKILGLPGKKSEFFQWITTLHRSLFAHEVGRFFVGLTAFLLLLIAASGIMLIIQRQRGLKRFFTRIARDNFAQYYHVVLGRLSLIPILIIALTGTYLSLEKFGLISSKNISSKIDFNAIRSKPVKSPANFDIFKSTKLSQVQTVEFPFSEDAQDYYTLKLNDREIALNQITGDILSENRYSTTVLLNHLSLNLHTGRTSILWAIILAIASSNILFFIYSGFAISWKRIAGRTKNKYRANESRFIILVGSENGSTFRYAQAVHQQLLKRGERSFLTELNNYTVFPEAEYMIILTATYGIGNAPANAAKFAALLGKYRQPQLVRYSVLGFGSHAYPDFCKFAFDVNRLLSRQDWGIPLTDIYTVNDKSPDEFSLWAEAWSQEAGVPITVLTELHSTKVKRLETFMVTFNAPAGHTSDHAFLIRMQPKRSVRVTSGDLLAIYPAEDHRERLYSIGVLGKEIQLSVRLHPNGLGSGYLHRLKPGETVRARIINNEYFHFPGKAPQVVMISNGTGIAPFLGMISQNTQKTPCSLYCGFRESLSFEKHRNFLEENKIAQKLQSFHVVLSREGEKQYISDLIFRDADFVVHVLSTNGVLMICGSLSMQKDVIQLLENICQEKLGKSVSFYQSRSQVLMDCY